MQRHQLGLIWGAFVTAGGAININSVLGFLVFVLGLVVSYKSAVALGMPGVAEQISIWKEQLVSKRSKTETTETSAPEKQAV